MPNKPDIKTAIDAEMAVKFDSKINGDKNKNDSFFKNSISPSNKTISASRRFGNHKIKNITPPANNPAMPTYFFFENTSLNPFNFITLNYLRACSIRISTCS